MVRSAIALSDTETDDVRQALYSSEKGVRKLR